VKRAAQRQAVVSRSICLLPYGQAPFSVGKTSPEPGDLLCSAIDSMERKTRARSYSSPDQRQDVKPD